MCINWRLPVYSRRNMGINSSKDTGVILLFFTTTPIIIIITFTQRPGL